LDLKSYFGEDEFVRRRLDFDLEIWFGFESEGGVEIWFG